MAIIRNNNDMTLFFGRNNIARLLSNRQSAKINSPPKFPARRYNIHTEIMDEHANKTPMHYQTLSPTIIGQDNIPYFATKCPEVHPLVQQLISILSILVECSHISV